MGMKVDTVIHIKANIDDVDGERHGYIIDKLIGIGALDVNFTPLMMKKNRPGVELSVISKRDDAREIIDFLMSEGVSLGFRVREEDRIICDRQFKTVKVGNVDVTVKEAYWNGEVVSIKPEYEDTKTVASQTNLSLAKARELIMDEYKK